VGFIAWGEPRTQFSRLVINAEDPRAFMVSQFGFLQDIVQGKRTVIRVEGSNPSFSAGA
jgi:hypothetical protein